MEVLGHMCERGPSPTTALFNSAMVACTQAGQGQAALDLLPQLIAQGLHPDVVSKEGAREAIRNRQRKFTFLSIYLTMLGRLRATRFSVPVA